MWGVTRKTTQMWGSKPPITLRLCKKVLAYAQPLCAMMCLVEERNPNFYSRLKDPVQARSRAACF